jgi:EAL domain-containing protein (putative c-di-GMP-specific phosphodiesterase class I)
MDIDAEQRALVRGIAAMASELGVPSVAVGIERPEALALCVEFGIELGQGYLLGRPEAVDV